MNRDDAVRMIQGFFKSHGVDSPGLNESNLGGARIGEEQVYFEYEPAERTLKCSALVYRFRDDPKPGVIEVFETEAENTGGGVLEYQPVNKGLYLTRSYDQVVADEEFVDDLKRLLQAGRVYGDQVLDRVATKVFA